MRIVRVVFFFYFLTKITSNINSIVEIKIMVLKRIRELLMFFELGINALDAFLISNYVSKI